MAWRRIESLNHEAMIRTAPSYSGQHAESFGEPMESSTRGMTKTWARPQSSRAAQDRAPRVDRIHAVLFFLRAEQDHREAAAGVEEARLHEQVDLFSAPHDSLWSCGPALSSRRSAPSLTKWWSNATNGGTSGDGGTRRWRRSCSTDTPISTSFTGAHRIHGGQPRERWIPLIHALHADAHTGIGRRCAGESHGPLVHFPRSRPGVKRFVLGFKALACPLPIR